MPVKMEVGLCSPPMSHPAQIVNVGCLLDIWSKLCGNSNIPRRCLISAKSKKRTLESFCPIQTSFLSWLLAWCNVLCSLDLASFLSLLPCVKADAKGVLGWESMCCCLFLGNISRLPSNLVVFFFVKERFFFVAISLICGFISQHFPPLSPLVREGDGKAIYLTEMRAKRENSKINLLLQYI